MATKKVTQLVVGDRVPNLEGKMLYRVTSPAKLKKAGLGYEANDVLQIQVQWADGGLGNREFDQDNDITVMEEGQA